MIVKLETMFFSKPLLIIVYLLMKHHLLYSISLWYQKLTNFEEFLINLKQNHPFNVQINQRKMCKNKHLV